MAEIAGLKLIVPSSVAGSGVSVSASGKVTFTAATSVSVNGCFSSTYDNYLIVMGYDTSSTLNMRMRLRASGTDNSTASSYVYQYVYASGVTVSSARTTSSRWSPINGYATQRSGSHLYLYGPALSQPTALRSVNVQDSSSAYLEDHACTHNQSTAYDGFTFFSETAATATGSLTIYGLSQ